ncbi:MAG: hypothetical protein WED87_04230, partial [Dehalococcoidia bacterium]
LVSTNTVTVIDLVSRRIAFAGLCQGRQRYGQELLPGALVSLTVSLSVLLHLTPKHLRHELRDARVAFSRADADPPG